MLRVLNLPSSLARSGGLHAEGLFISARRNGAPAPGIVLDLDDTVLYRTRGLLDLLLLYANPFKHSALSVGTAYPDASVTIKELARHYRIAAITARSGLAAEHTARWLEKQGLGGMPLIHSARLHPGDHTRVAFKSHAIDFLKSDGGFDFQPLIGIGDRPSDVRTYRSQGMHAFAVAHSNVSSFWSGGGGGSALKRGLEAVSAPSVGASGSNNAEAESASAKAEGGNPIFVTKPERRPATILFTDNASCFSEAARMMPLSQELAASDPVAGRGFLRPLALHSPLLTGSGLSPCDTASYVRRTSVWAQIRDFLLEKDGEAVLSRMSEDYLQQQQNAYERYQWVRVMQAQSRDFEADAAAKKGHHHGGTGAGATGGDHWEEEATATWYVKDTPKDILDKRY